MVQGRRLMSDCSSMAVMIAIREFFGAPKAIKFIHRLQWAYTSDLVDIEKSYA